MESEDELLQSIRKIYDLDLTYVIDNPTTIN